MREVYSEKELSPVSEVYSEKELSPVSEVYSEKESPPEHESSLDETVLKQVAW